MSAQEVDMNVLRWLPIIYTMAHIGATINASGKPNGCGFRKKDVHGVHAIIAI